MDEVLAYPGGPGQRSWSRKTPRIWEIIPGGDYCTLVTCTPYAINTHRMLVRGTRVPYTGEDEQPDTPQTVQYQQLEYRQRGKAHCGRLAVDQRDGQCGYRRRGAAVAAAVAPLQKREEED